MPRDLFKDRPLRVHHDPEPDPEDFATMDEWRKAAQAHDRRWRNELKLIERGANPEDIHTGVHRKAKIQDVHTALVMRELAGAPTISDTDAGEFYETISSMGKRFEDLERRGKVKLREIGKYFNEQEPRFEFPFSPDRPMATNISARQPVDLFTNPPPRKSAR